MLVNSWYLGRTVDKLTSSFVILASLPARLVGWSVKWKVVDLAIHATWMYDHALMMVICRLRIVVTSELRVEVLGRDSLEVEIIGKVLGRLFFFCESNQKVIT